MAAIASAAPRSSLSPSLPSSPSPLPPSRFCPPIPAASRPRLILSMANPAPAANLGDKLSQSIKEAEAICSESPSGECAAAWDEVEEISAEIAHKKVQSSQDMDPLEKFCKDQPEADECRVYED